MPISNVTNLARGGTKTETFVSIVAAVDKHTADLAGFVSDLDAELSRRYANYEVIIVDNGLASDLVVELRELLAVVPCVRVLRLSRTFQTDTALFAGLEAAIGDFVVVMTPGSDPIEVVSQIVDQLRDGRDIVQGMSTTTVGGPLPWLTGRRLFYWYNRTFLSVTVPIAATNLTGMTRSVVNSLTNTSRSYRYLRHLIRHVGYRLTEFPYTPTAGTTRVRPGWREAVEMVSSYSTQPLRAVTIIGVIAGALNLIYALYVIVVNLLLSNVAQGWTTTSLQLSLMFFLLCTILAVQSEYIGRILTETRREPRYIVMEEIESDTLIVDLTRRNVSN